MWENINFETHMIEIREAVVHPVNVAVTKETKNEFSVRPFSMCDQLYNIMKGCREQRCYVISKEDGSSVTGSSLSLKSTLSASLHQSGANADLATASPYSSSSAYGSTWPL